MLHDQEKMFISYMHNEHIVESEIAYSEIEAVCPGLAATIVELDKQNLLPVHLILIIKATCSHIFGNFIDLRKAGFMDITYPYITNLVYVRPANSGDRFVMEGVSYRLLPENENGNRVATINPSRIHVVSAKVVDTIWADSSKSIPIMTALGYTDTEILKKLEEGSVCRDSLNNGHLPQF